MTGLTDRQLEVLRFIAREIEERGYPPTIREIGEALDIRSTNGVNDHLKALERKGFLTRDPVKSRALIPTEAARGALGGEAPPKGAKVLPFPVATRPGSRMVEVPILGRVAAGVPISAQADFEGQMLFDRAAFFPRPDYLLRVKGDSMRDDGIFDGDLIAVHRTNVAENGQIVVARIDGEITVKRFKQGRDRITLLPRNPDYAPIVVAPDADFAIEGLYCGLVRSA